MCTFFCLAQTYAIEKIYLYFTTKFHKWRSERNRLVEQAALKKQGKKLYGKKSPLEKLQKKDKQLQ